MATPSGPSQGGSSEVDRSPVATRRGLFAFLGELQRRRVIGALAIYGTVAFAVLQVVEPVMHGLHLPDVVLSVVVVVLGLGFPVVTFLAWAFDLTTGGIERTPSSPGTQGYGLPRGARLVALLLGTGLVLATPGVAYHFLWGSGSTAPDDGGPRSPLAGARFTPLTDFDGIEEAAAISRDGRFVAFQSDRDGRMDVWVTQVGTGQFSNLTRGTAPEIVNPYLRSVGFSPDGSLVTFWGRAPLGPKGPSISVWASPLLGGPVRPYLEGVAEYDWSTDGQHLAFHTPGPGDPTFVSDSGQPSDARKIFSAPEGLHAHFQIWSPDRAFIYFVQGTPPDRLDVWRIRPDGQAPERMTHHDALVTHPVFVDAGTLLYLATDADGAGPYIFALDLARRESKRVSVGVDCFTSLAASADGRRLVATLASPKGTLWRVPLAGGKADMSRARRIPLTTGSGSSPRLGPGFLVYVSSKGTGDSLWKLQGVEATEIWSAPDTRIVGAPAIRRDGRRIAFSARKAHGRTSLHAVNPDGTDARVVTTDLELRGAPAWAPDGESITVAALADGVPRLVSIPAGGGPARSFVAEPSVDPAWSPDGRLLAYTGADVGTTYPVRAVTADASAYPVPPLMLTRGARHLAFAPGGRSLLVLRGDIRHKDLWQVDLDTASEHPITAFAPDFDVRDFDVAPDGSEVVLEQVQVRSDIVLVERGQR